MNKELVINIKNDLLKLEAPLWGDIKSDADLELYMNIIRELSTKYRISEDDVINIASGVYDSMISNINDELNERSTYYRVLSRDQFIDEFNSEFNSEQSDRFKMLLTNLENDFPSIKDIITNQQIFSEGGATFRGGTIKRLANSNKPEVKQILEFRVSSKGAKPTLYNTFNIEENYIFLGSCHKKDNGDRGEDAYIDKALNRYIKFLSLRTELENTYLQVELL